MFIDNNHFTYKHADPLPIIPLLLYNFCENKQLNCLYDM